MMSVSFNVIELKLWVIAMYKCIEKISSKPWHMIYSVEIIILQVDISGALFFFFFFLEIIQTLVGTKLYLHVSVRAT